MMSLVAILLLQEVRLTYPCILRLGWTWWIESQGMGEERNKQMAVEKAGRYNNHRA